MAKKKPVKKCWRCKGKGYVESGNDEDTPCGACLGAKVAQGACPKCGSPMCKILSDGVSVAWHCRDCLYRGPWASTGAAALKLWNALSR